MVNISCYAVVMEGCMPTMMSTLAREPSGDTDWTYVAKVLPISSVSDIRMDMTTISDSVLEVGSD